MARKKTLKFNRVFTKAGEDPYGTEWETRDVSLPGKGDTVVFKQDDVECPKSWSDKAIYMAASKYFRGNIGTPRREYSVKQLFNRVVDTITAKGVEFDYFTKNQGETFSDELKAILIQQRGAFNSPVFFNVGAVDNPQGSACFILRVEDNLQSIVDLQTAECMLFSQGSGMGVNLSTIREAGAPLSRGGVASGPISYARAYDGWAAIIKSAGRQRRAAMFLRLNDRHPDVWNGLNNGTDFTTYKSHEEKKAWALIDAGYSGEFQGEAYETISGQNANLSVGISDDFMRAAVDGLDWSTYGVLTKAPANTFPANDLLKGIAAGTWLCGDPGVQFDDRINEWNTCSKSGRINSSNPCHPGWALVLTPAGIRMLDDVNVGNLIWSGKDWTKITVKQATGEKAVYAYKTRSGTFYGTEEHRIVQDGVKIEVKYADNIDIAIGPEEHPAPFNAQDVMDGLVLGDGMVHAASKNLPPLLCIGKDDQDYFDSEIASLVTKERDRLSKHAWEVTTTLTRAEVPKTYNRQIPDRFLFGTYQKTVSFLRGLYSANGSIVDARVTLKTSSPDIRQGTQTLLSSIGIRSYYTTNKATSVEFSNGEYTCRESYDINITSDRKIFKDLIGFIQKDKQERLIKACKRPTKEKRTKQTYEIIEKDYLGIQPVYDITVDAEEHTYWTGGLLVSNCSEFLFLDNSACNLFSLNLLSFFEHGVWDFDDAAFTHAVRIAIIAQDILVEMSGYPTEEIANMSKKFRPLGLGFCNIGGTLMAMGIPYDSDEGRLWASALTSLMTGAAYTASAEMAELLGPFEGYKTNRVPMTAVLKQHRELVLDLNADRQDPELVRMVSKAQDWWGGLATVKEGFRNAQTTLLAPTGTISFLMDSATQGIEPALLLIGDKQLSSGGTLPLFTSTIPTGLKSLGYDDVKIERIMKLLGETRNPEKSGIQEPHLSIFDAAYPPADSKRCVSVSGHLKMMAAVQPFISGAISKTVGVPRHTTEQEIREILIMAWRLGLKSVSIYRSGSKRVQPLNVGGNGETTLKQADKCPLPETRMAHTHKFNIGGQEGFITVGFYDDMRVGEVFLQLAKEGATVNGFAAVLGRSISAGLQRGVPLQTYISQLINTKFDPQGFTPNKSIKACHSVPDYLAKFLMAYENPSDMLKERTESMVCIDKGDHVEPIGNLELYPMYEVCPDCGNLARKIGLCLRCDHCGFDGSCG